VLADGSLELRATEAEAGITFDPWLRAPWSLSQGGAYAETGFVPDADQVRVEAMHKSFRGVRGRP